MSLDIFSGILQMKFDLTTEEKNAILDYEEILRKGDPNKKISSIYFKGSDEENHKRAKHIMQYVFTNILRWAPEDVLNRASKEVLADLQLTIPYSKLIFPRELSKKRDYFYIAKILFPKDIKSFSRRDMIIHFYQQILDREIVMPGDYFNDKAGMYKASVCLRYYLSRDTQFKNTEALYDFFNDDAKAMKYLKTAKLDKVCRLYFDDPLHFLDYSMPAQQADSLVYFNLRFHKVYDGSDAQKIWSAGITDDKPRKV